MSGDHKDRIFDGKLYSFSSAGIPRAMKPEITKLKNAGYPVRVIKSTRQYPDIVSGKMRTMTILTMYVRWDAKR